MRRRTKILSVMWASMLLVLPGALSWFDVHTSPEAENRIATDWPDPARPGRADWYGEVSAFVEDRLALSGLATRGLRSIDLRMGRLPATDVLVGQEGHLFLRESLRSPCLDGMGLDRERSLLERLESAAAGRGIRVVLMVVPDKMVMVPDRVPAAFRGRASCLRDRARASEAMARQVLGHDDVVPVERLLDRDGSYFPQDSHWAASGRRRVIRDLVERLRPGMWDPTAVRAVMGERAMDLRRLAGVPHTARVEENALAFAADVKRTPVPGLDRGVVVTAKAARGRRLVDTPALVVHDSFIATWPQEFMGLFADAGFVHWSDVERPSTALRALVAGRQVIVVETVGRSYWGERRRIRDLAEAIEAD